MSYIVFQTRGRKRNLCYGKLQQDVTFHYRRLALAIWCIALDKLSIRKMHVRVHSNVWQAARLVASQQRVAYCHGLK